MKTSQEIQLLALQRLAEARVLYQNGHPDGAFYLGGYAVELALKAIICKHLDIDDLFANKEYLRHFGVHEYKTLLIFTGLQKTLLQEASVNEDFYNNWQQVSDWKSTSRYASNFDQTSVEEFLDAIDHPQNGILTWLQKHW